MGKQVTVYHITPMCSKCTDEVSKIRKASEQAGAAMHVSMSLWKRLKFALQLASSPIVVIDDRPFSILGAFGEEALIAELKRGK